MASEIQIILGLITLAGVISGGIIAGRYAERKARVEATASPYEALANRVTKLEDQNEMNERRIATLEDDRAKDRAYIRGAVPWIAAHQDLARWPGPIPPDWWTEH